MRVFALYRGHIYSNSFVRQTLRAGFDIVLYCLDTQNAVLALSETDIHAVAGLLKLYFRELPQSLFTGKLYRKFVEGYSKFMTAFLPNFRWIE